MSILKCGFCGGTSEIVEGATIAECKYCGNKIPIDNGKRETIHRIVDEAKLKELENLQKKMKPKDTIQKRKRNLFLKQK